MDSAKESIADLQAAIKALHSSLHPHLSIPLHETLEKLDKIEQAKFLTCLAYSIHQLRCIQQQLNYIDPQTTGAAAEAKRTHKYLAKIEQVAGKTEKRPKQMDTIAADRFIKAALASGGKKASHTRFKEDAADTENND